MKQKWLLTGTALLLAAALAGCGNMPAADQAAKISMEQAQTAALDAANIDAADADISSATLSEVAGVTCYKVEFTSGNHTYAYSINAESGEVLEASYRDKNAAPTDSAQTDTTASGATTTPARGEPTRAGTMTRVETTSADAEYSRIQHRTRATNLDTYTLKGSMHGLRRTDSYPQVSTMHPHRHRFSSGPYPHDHGYSLWLAPAQRR